MLHVDLGVLVLHQVEPDFVLVYGFVDGSVVEVVVFLGYLFFGEDTVQNLKLRDFPLKTVLELSLLRNITRLQQTIRRIPYRDVLDLLNHVLDIGKHGPLFEVNLLSINPAGELELLCACQQE